LFKVCADQKGQNNNKLHSSLNLFKKKINLILLLSGKNPVNFTSYNKVVPGILPGKRSMYLHSHIKISFRLIETKARQ